MKSEFVKGSMLLPFFLIIGKSFTMRSAYQNRIVSVVGDSKCLIKLSHYVRGSKTLLFTSRQNSYKGANSSGESVTNLYLTKKNSGH